MYFSLKYEDGNLIFLDQTKLPIQENYVHTDDYIRIAEAIERLEIRGAPAIGVAAAYAIALSFKSDLIDNRSVYFNNVYERLYKTRPTAVNLFYALNRMKENFLDNINSENIFNILLDEAINIHNEDEIKCSNIAKIGLTIFRKKSNVLTHCNTGKLATAGDGTAFNIIKTAFEKGLVNLVYADETRPLLQGSRLTAFELEQNNIPFSLLTDSSAAFLMQQNKVDLVITGADRIALNGDSANKVGTYNLAILCNYHNIPFYIAAPTTTIDRKIASGLDIEIEYRSPGELLEINGNQINNSSLDAYTPAFDITPSHLITGIITDENLYTFPYNFIK